MSERLRGIVHRIAGVALIAAGIYHVFYLWPHGKVGACCWTSRPGRRTCSMCGRDALLPGLSSRKPEFGRFTYGEKAEYWPWCGHGADGHNGHHAVGQGLGGQSDGALVGRCGHAIHFYEAILATLAIVVWHFYQVFLDPMFIP